MAVYRPRRLRWAARPAGLSPCCTTVTGAGTPPVEEFVFTDADTPGANRSNRVCGGPAVDPAAVRLRGRSRCELRWHLCLLELIYVMLELFTARFIPECPTGRNRSRPWWETADSRRGLGTGLNANTGSMRGLHPPDGVPEPGVRVELTASFLPRRRSTTELTRLVPGIKTPPGGGTPC